MSYARTLVLVMAGGEGSRLGLLTDNRPKPAVPYGGMYRLIDVPLSNCLHSGLSDVWVLQQYIAATLSDHLANGRPWDLDRTTGGLLLLPPHLGTSGGGWHKGTADSVWRNRGMIRDFRPESVVVVSADAAYRLDYGKVLERHREAGAGCTMVTTRVAPEEASRYGVVDVDGNGRVTEYAYKPEDPVSDLVANEVFVFHPERLVDTLDEIAEDADDLEEGLGDFGDDLLPALAANGEVVEYRFDAYWRDVGTVESYLDAHRDLLGSSPEFALDDPDWPFLSQPPRLAASRVLDGATVRDSLLSPGCAIHGVVEESVLSPGVVVEEGATVRDAVLHEGVVVRRGAVVERAVLDRRSEIGEGAKVGSVDGPAGDEGIAVVSAQWRVPEGEAVAAGARLGGDEE